MNTWVIFHPRRTAKVETTKTHIRLNKTLFNLTKLLKQLGVFGRKKIRRVRQDVTYCYGDLGNDKSVGLLRPAEPISMPASSQGHQVRYRLSQRKRGYPISNPQALHSCRRVEMRKTNQNIDDTQHEYSTNRSRGQIRLKLALYRKLQRVDLHLFHFKNSGDFRCPCQVQCIMTRVN